MTKGLAVLTDKLVELNKTRSKKNTVYFGQLGIPVSLFQTHQLLLELTGLVMDNANKMGPEWAENSF